MKIDNKGFTLRIPIISILFVVAKMTVFPDVSWWWLVLTALVDE